jgi:hypothetical protein
VAQSPPIGEELTDSLFDFAAGMNAGVTPAILPKNQLAFATNATVRGTLVSPRATYAKMLLDFGNSIDLQNAATKNLFQGATYYKPDTGLECLMAAVAGRLFQFQVDGEITHVTEITTPALQQSAAAQQAWLWQSERWVIFNDGVNLPLFYDGASIRRSLGNSNSVAGTTSGFTVSSPIGSSQGIPLIGPYTGPLPGNILIGGFKFQIISQSTTSPSAFTIGGTVANGNAGANFPVGSFIKIASGYYGITQNALAPTNAVQTLNLSAPYTGPVGAGHALSITGQKVDIISSSNGGFTLSVVYEFDQNFPFTLPSGTAATIFGQSYTFTTVGTLNQVFASVANGGAFSMTLNAAYTGSLNAYAIVFNGSTLTNYQILITSAATNPTTVYTAQVTNAANLSAGAAPPGTIFPNPTSLILTGLELPAGRMGAYVNGRNWVSLTDGFTFIASDLVGSSSGTIAYNFRDAVLNAVENAYIIGGGLFRVPASGEQITAMVSMATLDNTLNGGPLAVLTSNTVFSCNAPVDRLTWANLTYPLLPVVAIDCGSEGQNCTTVFNSDLVFRSEKGISSLILARRNFDTWGNVPISREVEPILSLDNKTLLSFASSVSFDNRRLQTANPIQTSLGVYHTKLVVLNADPLSSLGGKLPSVYDGAWQDLNVLQLMSGKFQGVKRAFAFCLSADLSAIELWEILPSSDTRIEDVIDPVAGTTRPITWSFETPVLFREQDLRQRRFKRLTNGEIFIDQLIGQADFQVFYRPDDYPSWIPWLSWSEVAKLDAPVGSNPQFRPRMGLGEPSGIPCDNVTNRPFREGYYFQLRVIVKGHPRFKGARLGAITCPEPKFAAPKC